MSSFLSLSISSVPVLVPCAGFSLKDGVQYDVDQATHYLQKHKDFQRWLQRTQAKFGEGFKQVRILSIYPFGTEDRKDADGNIVLNPNGQPARVPRPVGFVWIDADIQCNGKIVPGAALIRGDAVAMLPILRASENPAMEFTITTVQPRAPLGESAEQEVPAGMLDGSNTFAGVAAKEMAEETGLTFSENEMELIGEMTPSGGGCDERLKLFRCIKVMPLSDILALQGKLTGNLLENESIALKLWRFRDFVTACRKDEITDAKAKCLLFHHLSNMYEIVEDASVKAESLVNDLSNLQKQIAKVREQSNL